MSNIALNSQLKEHREYYCEILALQKKKKEKALGKVK